jgi:peptidoglycan/xylan/chitin deacetylase (PgdA/CDA1 family)
LTHDIDSSDGLKKAIALKKLESKYDLPSTWFIPTKQYELNNEIVRELRNHGEVGAHDTKHDGKLSKLPKQKIVDRLFEAKQTLEEILGEPIRGFRAPLLQFNSKLIKALAEVGYLYDSSCPTWEPNNPSTMKPHGIGTVFPLDFHGVQEIPVSVPQDHQMIQILGLSLKRTIEKWLEIYGNIKELGGVYTILVHPDYEFANKDGLGFYEELLNEISIDKEAVISLPSDVSILLGGN